MPRKNPPNQLTLEDSDMIDSIRDSIVVVCAVDNNYAMPLAATMRSVIENLKGERRLALFIIDGGIKENNKRKILKSLSSEKCEVNWISNPVKLLGEVGALKELNFGQLPHLSISAYYRMLIPELLPQQYSKAIYLDSDVIVVGDLNCLWDIKVQDNYLLAVQEIICPYVSSSAGLANYQELGIPADTKYFTSGVLVFNLEKCRTDKLSAKCVEYLVKYREYIRWHDTDVLNAVIAGKWGELDPRWNQMPFVYNITSWKDTPFSEDTFNKLIHDPYIIHFASAAKPWNSREDHPCNHLFFHYLDLTAWSGWRLTIWRRLWRRINREIKQFRSLISQQKTRQLSSQQS